MAKKRCSTSNKPLTEGDLMALVARRYPTPEWAFLRQVRSATGFQAVERYADGIAINCYPSRGLELHGFEAKSSRCDWMRELKNPDKSCEIQRFCNRWWVVTSAGLVKSGELPPTWGLLEVCGQKRLTLKCKVQAPFLAAEELDRGFVAAALRAAVRLEVTDNLLERASQEGADRAREAARKAAERQLEIDTRALEALRKTVADFQAASGLSICSWDAGRIGTVVATVMAQGPRQLRNQLENQIETVKRIQASLEASLQELPS